MIRNLVSMAMAAALMTFGALPAAAQQDHSAHHSASAQKGTDMADGEVRRIDKEARKITLRHGEIKSLDMPPMTMVFQVKDGALLEKVRTGDKVKFQAEKEGSAYIVVAIEPVK